MGCKSQTVYLLGRDGAVKHHSRGLYADKVPKSKKLRAKRENDSTTSHDVSPAGVVGLSWSRKEHTL
jgi:hypothetical protein